MADGKFLTTAAVLKYRSNGKLRIIRDSGSRSLYLIVAASGSKSWGMRFRRPDGKAGKMTLGVVDFSGVEPAEAPVVGMPLTLSGARQVAAQIHRDRMMGKDVVGEHKVRRRRKRAAIAEAGASTFGHLARKFITEHSRPRLRRWKGQARLLGINPRDLSIIPSGLADRWADRAITEIDGHDVHAVLTEVRTVGVPGLPAHRKGASSDSMARAFHVALSSFFGWALRERKVSSNPCQGVSKPQGSTARDRILSDAEIVTFWNAAAELGYPFGGILQVLLLTGCRLTEISALRWDELSEDGMQINLPASRTKNKRQHVVPLSPLARNIISSIPRIAGSQFCFTFSGVRPVLVGTKIKRTLDEKMAIPAWTVHDLRRTCATGMGELGVRTDVIEMALNHVSGARGGIAGTYNRSALLTERRAAVERWAAHVAGLVGGDSGQNVVQLHPERDYG
jgi:integrase